jgi:hypothetical protein
MLALCALSGRNASAQQTQNIQALSSPADALADALASACRADPNQFAAHLTSDNASAFQALTADQKAEFLQRFSLSDLPGKPLLSSDPQNHTELACETPSQTVEFRFGDTRVRDNLAFVPVAVVGGQKTEFGMVRENGQWRLLSLGLLLVDVPKLAARWADEELAVREEAVVTALQGLKEAIERYRNAYGKLPASLAQLGPAEPGQISPEQASIISKELAAGVAGGYHFRYRTVATADPKNQAFELVATPDDYGKTGRRSFLVDDAGRIHAADKHGAAATSDDPEWEAQNIQ